MRITTQLRATVTGILILGLGSVSVSFFTTSGQEGTVVNQAGIVRGASQRLSKLELADQSNDELIQRLDGIIKGLIEGDKELGLPAASGDFLADMRKVETQWKALRDTIYKVRRDPKAKGELLAASESFFKTANEAVSAAEKVSKDKIQSLRTTQIVIFMINVLVLAGVWLIINNISKTLKNFVSTIASASSEIAATVEQQERTIVQQSASVNETTTTVEELGASSRQSAEQADTSAAGAKEALGVTGDGLRAVEQTTEGLNNLKDKVRAIAEQIMRLSEQTGQISGVTAVVADIANQTNMLALNAAVEAARAGEQGKGFAVVASEIRKLADESKKSAERIYQLVSDVQAAMNSTVMVTDEGTKTADASIRLAQGTADAFNTVSEAINSVFLNNQQIALGSKQQAVGVQQVVSAMNAINLGAKETASGISQVKVSATNLNTAAKTLQALT